jgi:putative flippase GtrA
VNYYLSIKLLFRHKAKWSGPTEALIYVAVVSVLGLADSAITSSFVAGGFDAGVAKILSTIIVFILNFTGRRFIVFPERQSPSW